jgi:hypothetical protein
MSWAAFAGAIYDGEAVSCARQGPWKTWIHVPMSHATHRTLCDEARGFGLWGWGLTRLPERKARMSHRAIAPHAWLTTNTPGCAAKECGGLELDCSIELAGSQRTARAESVLCAYAVR